jgi:hypothetical protein
MRILRASTWFLLVSFTACSGPSSEAGADLVAPGGPSAPSPSGGDSAGGGGGGPSPIADGGTTDGGGIGKPVVPSSVLFFDDFEYAVSRSATDADVTFGQHGWPAVKANNSNFARGNGWLFTQPDAVLASRVLVMESRPGEGTPPPGFPYNQTDYYLRLGREGGPVYIPANAWFQFWTYATPESRFARRDKTIYPCRSAYPCQPGQLGWLFMWGSAGFQASDAPPGGRYLALQGEHADNLADGEYPTNKAKLSQNLDGAPLLPGRWYEVKLHMDVSGPQGSYEAWLRERGQPWKKIADWRGGVTANFNWPIPAQERGGFPMASMPTTVNGPGNSTVYLDDFALATSEAALPTYSN